MSTEPKWKVGDPVVIELSRYHYHHAEAYEPKLSHGTVTKVARKYFTVEITTVHTRFSSDETYTHTDTDQFEIVNGLQRCDPNFTNYRDRAYTPLEWEDEQLRQRLKAKLRELNFSVSSIRGFGQKPIDTWSTAHLIELVDLIERASMPDLDSRE